MLVIFFFISVSFNSFLGYLTHEHIDQRMVLNKHSYQTSMNGLMFSGKAIISGIICFARVRFHVRFSLANDIAAWIPFCYNGLHDKWRLIMKKKGKMIQDIKLTPQAQFLFHTILCMTVSSWQKDSLDW